MVSRALTPAAVSVRSSHVRRGILSAEVLTRLADAVNVNVFVSYAHEDSARAQQLIHVLSQSGLQVWWDGLIVAGTEFASTTEQALEAADVVIVLWSRSSAVSHWVRDEATRGRDRGCLVPVSLDGSEPPIGFRQYLFISLANWRGKADASEIRALMAAVHAAQGREPPARPPASVAPVGRMTRRRVLLTGGSLAVATLGAGAWYGWWRMQGSRAVVAANSVAVLPFTNLSGDPREDYFSDGLSAEVRAALAQNPRLRVMAQTSSEAFRNSKASATSIAQTLGVAYLLDGNVRRSGPTFRIAPELIDGLSGFSLWAQTFDRPIDDIFAVQSEIAGRVLAALTEQMRRVGGAVTVPLTAKTLPGGTTSVVAFDAYLRGRAAYLLSEGETSDRRALAEFEAAIAADPRFAAAHAARSRSLIVIANQYEDAAHTAATYDEAIKAARTATVLAPDLADAQSALAFALFQGRLDVKGAREPYQRSYQLGAGDAAVLGRFALYCALTGRDAEARSAMARAVELDPLNALVHRAMGSVLYSGRRYAQSLAPLRKALALNPKLSGAQAAIGRSLLMLGRTREAREAFGREPHELVRETGLAVAELKLGDTAAARRALDRLRADLGDSALYQQAQVAAQWGEREAAMKLLARAQALGDSGLIYIQTDPLLDPLRRLAAFNALRRQLGFE
jgi:TolB-like protein/tetratricopeptide (TPR) repeat protein